MKRDLTPDDLEKITQAILIGDRVEATSLYISITESGLTEAQAFIRALTAETNPNQGDTLKTRLKTKRNIWQRLIFPVKE